MSGLLPGFLLGSMLTGGWDGGDAASTPATGDSGGGDGGATAEVTAETAAEATAETWVVTPGATEVTSAARRRRVRLRRLRLLNRSSDPGYGVTRCSRRAASATEPLIDG